MRSHGSFSRPTLILTYIRFLMGILTCPPHQYVTLTLTLPPICKYGSLKLKIPPRHTWLCFLDDSRDQRLIADITDHRISSRDRACALCASRIYPGRRDGNQRGHPVPEQCFEPGILAWTERAKVGTWSLRLLSALIYDQVFRLRYRGYLARCSGEPTQGRSNQISLIFFSMQTSWPHYMTRMFKFISLYAHSSFLRSGCTDCNPDPG
jgi:hypothetical protein